MGENGWRWSAVRYEPRNRGRPIRGGKLSSLKVVTQRKLSAAGQIENEPQALRRDCAHSASSGQAVRRKSEASNPPTRRSYWPTRLFKGYGAATFKQPPGSYGRICSSSTAHPGWFSQLFVLRDDKWVSFRSRMQARFESTSFSRGKT